MKGLFICLAIFYVTFMSLAFAKTMSRLLQYTNPRMNPEFGLIFIAGGLIGWALIIAVAVA